MSYFPDKGNKNLAKYKNYEEQLIIILKNKSKLKIQLKNSFFIEKPPELFFDSGVVYNYSTGEKTEYNGIFDGSLIDSPALRRLF